MFDKHSLVSMDSLCCLGRKCFLWPLAIEKDWLLPGFRVASFPNCAGRMLLVKAAEMDKSVVEVELFASNSSTVATKMWRG